METALIIAIVVLTLASLTFSQDSTAPTLTITITEEEGSDIKIGSISEINLDVPLEEQASLRYSFLSNENPSYFSLNDISGDLYTMVKIDRESVCKTYTTANCELDFKVIATTSGTFTQTIIVKVIIEDINDNAPMFPENRIELNVPEGTVNVRFVIPSADDLDTGKNNGIQSYEIDPPSDTFSLISLRNPDGSFSLELVVEAVLNREAQDLYQIRIVAKDGGAPQKVGILNVDILVTDMNDNKPVFDQPTYNVSVEEGTPKGATVLKVNAVDIDSGANGKVSYRIKERSSAQVLADFSINETSGEIKVAKEKLTFQLNFHYSFFVEALDGGQQPQVSQAFVSVYVTDTGNNPPKVTLSLLSPGNIGSVNVSENSKLGFFVAYITVEDSDTGVNGQVTCSVSNDYFNIVKVQDKEYKVVVSTALNREVQDLHNVTVLCSDHGDPPLQSSVSFLVRVTDFNDNKPTFIYQNYKAKISENANKDKVILQVSANDNDTGVNQRIHYEIRNQDKILIDNISGVITAKPFFDREVTPVVVFEVLAIDGGESPLTGTATVTLTIEDLNDNAPKFTQTSYEFAIVENLNSGTSVGHVAATDRDIGENGMFIFSLSPEFIDNKVPFHVFDDGVIQSNRALDREEQSRYDFSVVVKDLGSPALSSIVLVTVLVKDVNDNHPNITFPTKDNKNRTVTMYYPSDDVEVVTQIKAQDIDAGENKTLKYSITRGNELGLFKMDESTGIITVADKTVMIDQDLSIALRIEVHDQGIISLSSTAELIVNVIYTNATYDGLTSESSKFVVIVVVVVVVTILLSAVIIGVIFLLRTMDRKKKLTGSKDNVENNCYSNKHTMYILNNTGESSTDYIVPNSDPGRKKKEVSFSLDDHDSMNSYQNCDLQVSMAPDPIHYAPEKPPRLEKSDSTQDLYDKVATRLENLKIQRMLQIAKHQQQAAHANPDDSRSETSGETSSGDSGRGASEEEVTSASPSHDDQKMFDYSIPTKLQNSAVQNRVVPSRANNYSAVPPPIPCRTYKPYGSFNNNQNYSPNNRQYLSAPMHLNSELSVLDPSMLSWQHSQPHSNHPIKSNSLIAQNDFAYLMARDVRKRSQDDDDCSTTTSGSYTLHSERMDDLL